MIVVLDMLTSLEYCCRSTSSYTINLDDLAVPLTAEDADAFLRVITKLVKKGRTVAQAKTLLQAGVTVSV